ncbi:flavin reductase family protein [Micromonospora sp. NPDC050276]|uniref:flavin reductase family protein n=1 Tax=Micromonospora sp. NPDC050276 TaxID=3364278 RepID=UPI0037BA26FE
MNSSSPSGGRSYDQARDVLGRFASGVVVITAVGPDGPVGLTCQSFVSLSLDPPLISVAVARTSRSWPKIRQVGTFGVNVLAEDQRGVSDAFARSGGDKFAAGEWSLDDHGVLLLVDACAWITCKLINEYDGGDHSIAVGAVLALQAGAREPLVYHRSGYRRLA